MRMQKGVFHFIAPVYGLFHSYQRKRYKRVLADIRPIIDFSAFGSIVDIGCGTGALCYVLAQLGLKATGVDPVERMLAIARRKNKNLPIKYVLASALDQLPFLDGSFDLAVAAYVAHGLTKAQREKLYLEMARISRFAVILFEYNSKRSLPTDFIEWLEKGDYQNFIQNVLVELHGHFANVQIVEVGRQAAVYICFLDR